jgi:hypothetical protein
VQEYEKLSGESRFTLIAADGKSLAVEKLRPYCDSEKMSREACALIGVAVNRDRFFWVAFRKCVIGEHAPPTKTTEEGKKKPLSATRVVKIISPLAAVKIASQTDKERGGSASRDSRPSSNQSGVTRPDTPVSQPDATTPLLYQQV